jgi:hypothetical protein
MNDKTIILIDTLSIVISILTLALCLQNSKKAKEIAEAKVKKAEKKEKRK